MTELNERLDSVRALLFDVFGTTVDWRSTVTRALNEQCQRTIYLADECSMPRATREKAAQMEVADWGQFAAQWREAYYSFTRGVAAAAERGATDKYKTVDEHHLESLVDELKTWGLEGLWDQETLLTMSRIWHFLDPWPDSVEGIRNMNSKGYKTCTLSNGNVELLTDMAEHAQLKWTHIFSSAMFESYKPNPKVYLGAAEKLGIQPHECCMVAAHLNDLEAAAGLGFRTIYVERDQEEAWSREKAAASKDWVDLWVDVGAGGFRRVAEQLKDRPT